MPNTNIKQLVLIREACGYALNTKTMPDKHRNTLTCAMLGAIQEIDKQVAAGNADKVDAAYRALFKK